MGSKNRWPSLSELQNSVAGKNAKNVAVMQNKPNTEAQTSQKVFIPQRSEQRDWLAFNLGYWCNERSLILETEYKFHPERKFRFDFYIPLLFTAVEFDGVISEKSRHLTIAGFSRDCTKMNEAQKMGIRVLRYTVINYKDVLQDLTTIYYNKQIPF